MEVMRSTIYQDNLVAPAVAVDEAHLGGSLRTSLSKYLPWPALSTTSVAPEKNVLQTDPCAVAVLGVPISLHSLSKALVAHSDALVPKFLRYRVSWISVRHRWQGLFLFEAITSE